MVRRGGDTLTAVATLTWRQRFDPARFLRGFGPEAGPVTLRRDRVYILPTRQGLLFGLVLLAMLLGAINYDNSLAYALVFFLASLGIVAILHTYRNLRGLTVQAGRCMAVFAGETARFTLGLENDGANTRHAIALALPQGEELVVDVTPGLQWVSLATPTARRGRLALGRVTLGTRFPLGLLRAWAHVDLGMQCLVYPAPTPVRGLPTASPGRGGRGGNRGQGHEDFASLRPYHPGDSLRHVHWKAVAREQGLQTKQFSGDQTEEMWLAWDLLPGVNVETRLQRLCRWVLEADAAGIAYGLLLPDRRIEPTLGETHRRRCLEALALFGEEA